jgi:hypothetical protein
VVLLGSGRVGLSRSAKLGGLVAGDGTAVGANGVGLGDDLQIRRGLWGSAGCGCARGAEPAEPVVGGARRAMAPN